MGKGVDVYRFGDANQTNGSLKGLLETVLMDMISSDFSRSPGFIDLGSVYVGGNRFLSSFVALLKLCEIKYSDHNKMSIKINRGLEEMRLTPAGGCHGLWPWMNVSASGRDVASLGRQSGATVFACGLRLTALVF
jgi:hypothetical protein